MIHIENDEVIREVTVARDDGYDLTEAEARQAAEDTSESGWLFASTQRISYDCVVVHFVEV
jgi:hypothetical protein